MESIILIKCTIFRLFFKCLYLGGNPSPAILHKYSAHKILQFNSTPDSITSVKDLVNCLFHLFVSLVENPQCVNRSIMLYNASSGESYGCAAFLTNLVYTTSISSSVIISFLLSFSFPFHYYIGCIFYYAIAISSRILVNLDTAGLDFK